MSLLQLPEIRADHRLAGANFDLRPDAVDRWQPEARATGDEASISILDAIGENWEGTGVTSKRISAALRAIGQRDVVIDVNSPGGDFFEGVAIYNLLREHKAKVTVRILSLAASAASVIAMAGDEILMGDGAFLMIHNAWAVAVGNRHDFAVAAQTLEPFDQAMATLYAKRTGLTEKEVAALMDKETWINTQQAIKDGFATGSLEDITNDTNASSTRKPLALVEASLAKAGYSRSARRDTLKALFADKPGAVANPAKPSAGGDFAALLQTTINTLKGA